MTRAKGYERDELFSGMKCEDGDDHGAWGFECLVCGGFIRNTGWGCSNAVLPKTSHMKMHLRNGELTEKLRVRVVKIHETVYVPTSDLIAEPAWRRP